MAVALACGLAATAIAPAARAQPQEVAVPKAAPAASSVYTKDGLLGPVRLGPTVGFGAPDGMRFGLFATWKGLLGAGGALSTVPTIAAGPAQISRFSAEGFLRVHPFRGAFFLGLAGGMARTEGAMTQVVTADSSRVDLKTVASVVYLAPHAGFRWMLPFGMTVGFDAGVELPIVSSGPTYQATHGKDVQQVEGKGIVASAMTFAATKPVPVVRLLEIGYAF
jgi:hypothetical protein